MQFHLTDYHQTLQEDSEITQLLTRVFVEENYTDRSDAETMFSPDEPRKRGDIILAKSDGGTLIGMIIFVRPSSPARQVARNDEGEIQLLAVHPESRRRGIGTRLVEACEDRAISCGYLKMVLSTQQTMKDAHHIYERLGYGRNSTRDWSRNKAGRRYLVYEKMLQH